jgi:ADP-ribose pyrophosphatase YjhB (NUDIX family)
MRREYPEAPIVSVGAVIIRGDQVLIVRRGQEPRRGRWAIPGGVIELGEMVCQAARREVREECGIEIEPGEVVDVIDAITRDESSRVRFHYVLVDLAARYLSGEVTPSSDVTDARWVREDELADFDMSADTHRVIVKALHGGAECLTSKGKG